MKKWEKLQEISSFYTWVPKIMSICYTVPEIQPVRDIIFIFNFGLISALPPLPLPIQKIKIFKKWKKKTKAHRDIIILQMCTKNYNHRMYSSWDMVCNWQTNRQTDRQTDRQMDKRKSDIERWMPHLKNWCNVKWFVSYRPYWIVIFVY